MFFDYIRDSTLWSTHAAKYVRKFIPVMYFRRYELVFRRLHVIENNFKRQRKVLKKRKRFIEMQ